MFQVRMHLQCPSAAYGVEYVQPSAVLPCSCFQLKVISKQYYHTDLSGDLVLQGRYNLSSARWIESLFRYFTL